MVTGRPRKPTQTAELEGYFKKHPERKNHAEPKPKPSKPKCPAHLGKYAKTEWKSVTKILEELRLLHRTDRSALEQYCYAYGAWRECVEQVTRLGHALPIKNHKGELVLKRNPFAVEAHTHAATILKYLQEWGLTPPSRTRVEADSGDDDDNPFEEWLKKHGRS